MHIQPDGIAIARCVRAGAEPLIDLLEFRPCPAPAQRAQVLGQWVKEARLKGLPSVCVLHPGDYQLTQIDTPDVPPDELRAALRWRLKEFLPYRAEEAVVDGFDLPQAKGRPGPGMMMAAAAQAKLVKPLVELLQGADLELTAIDVPELALRNIAAQVPDQGGGVALVTLAQSGGLITISQGELLYLARALEFGEQQLAANPGHGDNLVLQLQRSLDYYEAQLAQRPASRVLLAPMGGDRDGLLARMNEQMGMATYAMDLSQVVDLAGEPPLALQARTLLAVGGALRQEAAA